MKFFCTQYYRKSEFALTIDTPYLTLQMSYGICVVSILEKINCIIMAPLSI